jgi:hypothetical protein
MANLLYSNCSKKCARRSRTQKVGPFLFLSPMCNVDDLCLNCSPFLSILRNDVCSARRRAIRLMLKERLRAEDDPLDAGLTIITRGNRHSPQVARGQSELIGEFVRGFTIV